MTKKLVKIKCNNPDCDNYTFLEISDHFDGKCNICRKTDIEKLEPSIEEIINFAAFELENANHHQMVNLPSNLYESIITEIELSLENQRKLANIIALRFYHNV